MFTAEMFAPIVDSIKEVMPIAIGAGVGVMSVTWVGKKGFSIVKTMINKG